MARAALTLALVLFGCLFGEGHSQECVNGLMSAERVRQLGRVAGNRRDNLNEQQRIVPDISFTCSGNVTKWILAGREGNENLPEVQIWRETSSGSGVYTKVHMMLLPRSTSEPSEIYEFTAPSPMDVQPGDVLGLFEPFRSWLKLYHTDQYGPVNYLIDARRDVTPPTGNFSISAADDTMNDMPLITVEFSPTDSSSASDCVRNFASMDAIEIALQQNINDERRQQRLIPGINFTCHGFITKWVFAARWLSNDYLPELQTWTSTNDTTYTKQGATTVSLEGGSAEITYYEYSPNPPHEFNDGDVLGMFIPDQPRLRMFFEEVDSDFLNYVLITGSDIFSPPEGNFVTTIADNTVNAAPLIAVEVSIPPLPHSTNSTLPRPSATTSHNQQTFPVQVSSELTSAVSGRMDHTSTPVLEPTDVSSSSSDSSDQLSRAFVTPTPVSEPTDESSSSSGISDQLSASVYTPTAIPQPTHESSSSSSNSYQLSASLITPTPIPMPIDESSSSSGSSDQLSASIDTPTPVPEPMDESSSSSGSSDQLSVGVFAGVAVGAVIGVILGVVFITVIVLWRRRTKEYVVSTAVVQENQAYGTAISTWPGLEKNPAYGAFEMTECDDGHHRDQADLGDYEMIDNRQYGVPHSEPNDMPEDLVYSYPYTNTDWPLPSTDSTNN